MVFGKADFDTKFCAKCGCDSFVVDSRYKDNVICRRRQCSNCGTRWSTKEFYVRAERKRHDSY